MASFMTEATICEGKEHEQMFLLAVNVTYHNSDRGESGVKATGHAAYGLQDRTLAQVAAVYDKRTRIEKSYEKFREARAMTTTPSTTIRLFYVGVSFLLEQWGWCCSGLCSSRHSVADEHLLRSSRSMTRFSMGSSGS